MFFKIKHRGFGEEKQCYCYYCYCGLVWSSWSGHLLSPFLAFIPSCFLQWWAALFLHFQLFGFRWMNLIPCSRIAWLVWSYLISTSTLLFLPTHPHTVQVCAPGKGKLPLCSLSAAWRDLFSLSGQCHMKLWGIEWLELILLPTFGAAWGWTYSWNKTEPRGWQRSEAVVVMAMWLSGSNFLWIFQWVDSKVPPSV